MLKIMEQVEACHSVALKEVKTSFSILKSNLLSLRYERLKIQFNFPRTFEFFRYMLGCLERQLRSLTVEP